MNKPTHKNKKERIKKEHKKGITYKKTPMHAHTQTEKHTPHIHTHTNTYMPNAYTHRKKTYTSTHINSLTHTQKH